MSVNQLQGHGTLIDVQLTPGGDFSEIAEMGDVTAPEFSRNEFDATTQNEDIDAYVLGVLRRGLFTVPLNFIPDESTHDHLTGVQKLLADNTMTGWRVRFTQVSPVLEWVMSGQVKSFGPITGPVDGKLAATLSVRFSGVFTIGGVTIGA